MSELSLYVHIPFCRTKCGYCSFISYSGRDQDRQGYVEALIKEIRLTQRQDVNLKTIYFGGGTPSVLSVCEIGSILKVIRECYNIDAGGEITLEANPGTVDAKYLYSLRELGINRLSLGVQSLDETDLAFLGRCHSVEEARRAIDDARQAGFDNLSLDFIYGLPNRPTVNWQSMLGEIIELGAEHLSLYGLTLEPDTPLGEAVTRGVVPAPDADQEATEYEVASNKLDEAGFRHYEISNWAHTGYESRHNTVYWKRGEYLGLGVAAHSFVDGRRTANSDNLDAYLRNLMSGELPPTEVEVIDNIIALSESIFLGLRLKEGISMGDIWRQFGIDLRGRFAAEIAELSGLGLVEVSGDQLRLTSKGRLLGNEVFLRFLPS